MVRAVVMNAVPLVFPGGRRAILNHTLCWRLLEHQRKDGFDSATYLSCNKLNAGNAEGFFVAAFNATSIIIRFFGITSPLNYLLIAAQREKKNLRSGEASLSPDNALIFPIFTR